VRLEHRVVEGRRLCAPRDRSDSIAVVSSFAEVRSAGSRKLGVVAFAFAAVSLAAGPTRALAGDAGFSDFDDFRVCDRHW